MSIPRGITRRDILGAIRGFEAGVSHPYGPSTKYDLVVDSRRYPPKAIVGLAARRLNGDQPLDPDTDFSGGDGPGAANGVLRGLGFEVVRKGTSSPSVSPALRGIIQLRIEPSYSTNAEENP